MALERLTEEFNQLEGAVRLNDTVNGTWDHLLVMAGSVEESRSAFETWIAPNSMRNVEPESGLRIMTTEIPSVKSKLSRSALAKFDDEGSLE
jgi:hypothetical protein